MNYDRPELRDLLAGHYVLGHMPARARARFERLLLRRADYARAVTDWEERLAPMLDAAPPKRPPRRVWRRLRRRFRAEAGSRERSPLDLFRSRGMAIAGVAAATFLIAWGLSLLRAPLAPSAPPAPSAYAVITTRQGVAQWVITVRGNRMHMHTVGRVAPPQGKSYQLWMLPGGGAKPVSLGLLPHSGEASEALSTALLSTLRSSRGLAVSIEPRGGSPTGQPTGPVVYTAPIASI